MTETPAKYAITEEELKAAILQCRKSGDEPSGLPDGEAGPVSHLWNTATTGSAIAGIHIRANQSFFIVLDKKVEIKFKASLKAGYEQPEKLFEEIRKVASQQASGLNTVVTLSGKHSHFFVTKAPNVAKNVLLKSFKIQMKHISGTDEDDLSFAKLPGSADGSDYILGTVNQKVRDQILTGLRKSGLKLLAWDIDILCYARAASLLWQKSSLNSETRFCVIIGSNRTRLILLAKDGRFFAPVLPMGIASFLEHLKATFGEPTANLQWLDEAQLTLSATDSNEVRQKKIIANQAIFTLYAPFAQQVKMQLFQACSAYNIPLPTHFAVFGPGADLFRIADGLELDLGIPAIDPKEWLEPQMVAALGATLWDKQEVRINCLPKGGGEILQNIREFIQSTKEKLQKANRKAGSKPKLDFGSFNPIKMLGMTGTVIVLLAAYPVWKRISVSSQLSRNKAEFESLGSQKDQILEFSTRQTLIEKKQALVKTLEEKKLPADVIVKEVLFSLPAKIRLNGLSVKDPVVTLRGVAQTQEDLEAYLELCSRMKTLTDPTPINVRREPHATSFEISLKIRS